MNLDCSIMYIVTKKGLLPLRWLTTFSSVDLSILSAVDLTTFYSVDSPTFSAVDLYCREATFSFNIALASLKWVVVLGHRLVGSCCCSH